VDYGLGFSVAVEVCEGRDEPVFQVAIKPLQESAHGRIVLIPCRLSSRKNRRDRGDERQDVNSPHVLSLSTEPNGGVAVLKWRFVPLRQQAPEAFSSSRSNGGVVAAPGIRTHCALAPEGGRPSWIAPVHFSGDAIPNRSDVMLCIYNESAVFDWDENNLRKIRAHRIRLEEVEKALSNDPIPIYEQDAEGEVRYVYYCETDLGRLLAVVLVERGEKIRVVTAYDLDAGQKKDYLARRLRGE
jgi:uncharacterized DUF497 family protein